MVVNYVLWPLKIFRVPSDTEFRDLKESLKNTQKLLDEERMRVEDLNEQIKGLRGGVESVWFGF